MISLASSPDASKTTTRSLCAVLDAYRNGEPLLFDPDRDFSIVAFDGTVHGVSKDVAAYFTDKMSKWML